MEIDPRGARVSALITTVVLAVVLVTSSGWLLAAQALVFAVGAIFGLRYSPYGVLYRRLIRPRLGPPGELEPEAPPRFAQAVGLVFALAGVAGVRHGPDRARHGRDRGRAGCRVPERGLRVLPGLRDVPAHPPVAADEQARRVSPARLDTASWPSMAERAVVSRRAPAHRERRLTPCR
jgi:hypothetical protein